MDHDTLRMSTEWRTCWMAFPTMGKWSDKDLNDSKYVSGSFKPLLIDIVKHTDSRHDGELPGPTAVEPRWHQDSFVVSEQTHQDIHAQADAATATYTNDEGHSVLENNSDGPPPSPFPTIRQILSWTHCVSSSVMTEWVFICTLRTMPRTSKNIFSYALLLHHDSMTTFSSSTSHGGYETMDVELPHSLVKSYDFCWLITSLPFPQDCFQLFLSFSSFLWECEMKDLESPQSLLYVIWFLPTY